MSVKHFAILILGTLVLKSTSGQNARQIPYVQNFGNDVFFGQELPGEFAIWTPGGAPHNTLSSAAASLPGSEGSSLDSASVVKTQGKAYGYSGQTGSGVQTRNGQVYIQTSSASSGTDQLALAINTTNYSSVTVSFDVEMINPQPRKSGFVFQYRIGTSGPFTTIDSSYWHNSADRDQGQVDHFVNLQLPAEADNQPNVQLRWATARDNAPAGVGSCGIGFDNIVVTGDRIGDAGHFRTTASGSWNNTDIWESSADGINWRTAKRYPASGDLSINIRNNHHVVTTGINNLVIDRVTIDKSGSLENSYNTSLAISERNGATDLIVNGTFADSSHYSVVVPAAATWKLGDKGTFVKTTNSSSTIWQLRYQDGIATIPVTSNWICRKPAGSSEEPSISTTNGGPPHSQAYYGNLYIENNATNWNPLNHCRFSGWSNHPIIKGNLYIGGNGNSNLNFNMANSHSSPVLVMGNVLIRNGSTLTVTGTGLEVQGDLTCNGTYTHAGSLSKLIFSGAHRQKVKGIGSITTNRLEFNKSYDDIEFENDILIAGNLNLLDGASLTASTSTMIIQDDATQTGASSLSYINGPLKKIGDDAFTFPVGKVSHRPIGMSTGNSMTVYDNFTAEYFNSNPQSDIGSQLGPGLKSISQCEYWILNQDIGSSSKQVTLSWDAYSCGVSDPSVLRVARFDGSKWVDQGNTSISGNSGGGTVTSALCSAFGPFTLAMAPEVNILDRSLLTLSAVHTSRVVRLRWVTSSETNSDFFTVERSEDGTNFTSVLEKQGAGTSSYMHSYIGVDTLPLPGLSYYRLRQTDYDGVSTVSDIIPVKVSRENLIMVSLEPSRENSTIDFDINLPYASKGSIKVSDSGGKLLLSSEFTSNPQIRHFQLNSASLKSGVYYLRVQYGTEVVTRKFFY